MNNEFSMKVMELLSNPSEAKKQINEFANQIEGSPKAQVEKMLASGQVSQGDYNMVSGFARLFMKFL